MNLLKTPHQKILEEAGASPMPSPGMLNTPKQMLFQESGILPKFAEGGRLFEAEENLTPEQMQAALIINGNTPPKFNYASGGNIESTPSINYSDLDLYNLFNFLQSIGAIK